MHLDFFFFLFASLLKQTVSTPEVNVSMPTVYCYGNPGHEKLCAASTWIQFQI